MSYTFTQNLREKLISYFLRVHGETISHEEADLYLASMATLYSAFSSSTRFSLNSGETRFPKETYRNTSTPRVGVKVEAREARTTLTP